MVRQITFDFANRNHLFALSKQRLSRNLASSATRESPQITSVIVCRGGLSASLSQSRQLKRFLVGAGAVSDYPREQSRQLFHRLDYSATPDNASDTRRRWTRTNALRTNPPRGRLHRERIGAISFPWRCRNKAPAKRFFCHPLGESGRPPSSHD